MKSSCLIPFSVGALRIAGSDLSKLEVRGVCKKMYLLPIPYDKKLEIVQGALSIFFTENFNNNK